MRQTLIAMAALMMTAFMNYSQMQASLRHQQEVVRSEIEQMALGVAMQTMEVVRAEAFDEKTINPQGAITNPETDLTAPEAFPMGFDCQAFNEPSESGDTCDDIDDFNDMETAVVPFETPQFDMAFNVDIEVRYVNASLEPCAGGGGWPGCTSVGPTFRKEVIIKVQDKRDNPYLYKPIRFSEVMTYY